MKSLSSGIIISQNFQNSIDVILKLKREEEIYIVEAKKEFLIEDAKKAINRAFVSNEKLEYIILIAPKFSTIAQNKLLKIVEEPPNNKNFILITSEQSSLLPTIKSRLPILSINRDGKNIDIDLDIENLNLSKIYKFIQENRRLDTNSAKELIQNIIKIAIISKKYRLDEDTLSLFSDIIKALDVGSPVSFVLNTLLLKLLFQKK